MLLRIFLDDTNYLRTSDLMMFFIFYLIRERTMSKEVVGRKEVVASTYNLLAMSKDCVFLVDEMYLQNSVQFHNGNFIGRK